MHSILLNIALDHEKLTYYQGMNYIVIFLFKFFKKNVEKTYKFLSFLAWGFLTSRFHGRLPGLEESLYILDKYIRSFKPELWMKFTSNHITSLNFSVSLIITVFSIYSKHKKGPGCSDPESPANILNEKVFEFCTSVWDMVIGGGSIYMIKTLLKLLEVNEHLITKELDGDQLLVGIGEMERSPFGLIDYITKVQKLNGNLGAPGSGEDLNLGLKLNVLAKMSKLAIKSQPFTRHEYERLKVHYWNIHEPILRFWSEP